MVLVTGGAKGIGRMISEGYVTNGATVYISSRDAKACEQAAKELNALGKGKAHAIPANFYKLEDVKKLAEELGKREGSKAPHLMENYIISNNMPLFSRAPRPRQQLRLELGRPLRRIPLRGLHASPHPQPPPRLRSDPARYTAPREGGYTGGSFSHYQYR